jgi:hypothetical protein
MFGLLGKVITNLFAFFITIGLLIGGCVYIGGKAIEKADEANRRNAAGRPQEDGTAPNVVSGAFEAAKNSFSKSIANDLIQQYEIVENGSDEMAKSIRAGAVAEAYLQAKDAASYERWKSIADSHMQKALGK